MARFMLHFEVSGLIVPVVTVDTYQVCPSACVCWYLCLWVLSPRAFVREHIHSAHVSLALPVVVCVSIQRLA